MALLVALLLQDAPSMADLIARWKSDDAAAREKVDADIIERWSGWKDDDLRRLEEASRGEDAEVAARAKPVLARVRMRRRAGAALVAKFPEIDVVLTKGDEDDRLELLRVAAAEELAAADKRTLVALALECEWPERGKDVAYLGAIIEAYRPLLTAMFRHRDANVRASAVEHAWSLESPEVAREFVPLLKDPEPLVRTAAAKAIGYQERVNLVEDVLPLLKDGDAGVREQALDAIGRLGGPPHAEAVAPLLKDANDDVRRQAVSTYGFVAPPSGAGPLIAVLKDPLDEVRAEAAEILGWMDARGHAGALLPLLEDTSEDVRLQAARALGVLGAAEAEEALARLLKDAAPLVRAAAARSLGEMLAERRAGDLRGLLKDERADLRLAAATALADLGTPPDIAELFRDPGRGYAVVVAWRNGLREHAGAIAPLLEDDTDWVALVAARALRSFGRTEEGARLVPWLKDANAQKRLDAIARIVALGDRRSEIAGLLRDENAAVRLAAAEAVGVLGLKPDALEALVADAVPEVQAAVVFAMARLGAEGAERRCVAAEASKDWCVAAAGSLGLARLGKKSPVDVMRRLETRWVHGSAPFDDELWETLERVHEPRAAERLAKPVETSKVVSTVEDLIDELKRACGLRLVIERGREQNVRLRGLLRKGWRGTAEQLVERAVRWGGMKIVVAGDEVRVMSKREALLYWMERLGK